MEQVIETVMIPVSERPLCSILALEIPADLVAEKSVTLAELSLLGVMMDFGEGLTLDQAQIVPVAVEPFTVPSGGIPVGFRTTEGESLSSTILSGTADAGLSVRAERRCRLMFRQPIRSYPVNSRLASPGPESVRPYRLL